MSLYCLCKLIRHLSRNQVHKRKVMYKNNVSSVSPAAGSHHRARARPGLHPPAKRPWQLQGHRLKFLDRGTRQKGNFNQREMFNFIKEIFRPRQKIDQLNYLLETTNIYNKYLYITNYVPILTIFKC